VRAARARRDLLTGTCAWLILLTPASAIAQQLVDHAVRAGLLAMLLAGIASLFVPLLLADLAALLRRGGLGPEGPPPTMPRPSPAGASWPDPHRPRV